MGTVAHRQTHREKPNWAAPWRRGPILLLHYLLNQWRYNQSDHVIRKSSCCTRILAQFRSSITIRYGSRCRRDPVISPFVSDRIRRPFRFSLFCLRSPSLSDADPLLTSQRVPVRACHVSSSSFVHLQSHVYRRNDRPPFEAAAAQLTTTNRPESRPGEIRTAAAQRSDTTPDRHSNGTTVRDMHGRINHSSTCHPLDHTTPGPTNSGGRAGVRKDTQPVR